MCIRDSATADTNKDSKFLPWKFDETLGSTYDAVSYTHLGKNRIMFHPSPVLSDSLFQIVPQSVNR